MCACRAIQGGGVEVRVAAMRSRSVGPPTEAGCGVTRPFISASDGRDARRAWMMAEGGAYGA